MGKQPTDDLEAVCAGGRGSDPCRPGDGVVTRARERPRGFYARLARARGVSLNAVYRKLNPDKRPSVRARHECDASPPWDPRELIRRDRAFCDAMRREIARGTERPRNNAGCGACAAAASPSAAPLRRIFHPSVARRDRRTRSVLLT
jgi:hypothetical protein